MSLISLIMVCCFCSALYLCIKCPRLRPLLSICFFIGLYGYGHYDNLNYQFFIMFAVMGLCITALASDKPIGVPIAITIDFFIAFFIGRLLDLTYPQYSGDMQYITYMAWYVVMFAVMYKWIPYRPALWSYFMLMVVHGCMYILYDIGTRESDIFVRDFIFKPIELFQIFIIGTWAINGRLDKCTNKRRGNSSDSNCLHNVAISKD